MLTPITRSALRFFWTSILTDLTLNNTISVERQEMALNLSGCWST